MSKKKLRIGITGSIGSGKSEFCSFISEKDFPVIKADDVSKKILLEDTDIRDDIIKEFGEQSFINHEINNKYLADKVFSDPAKVEIINSILHPKVMEKIESMNQEYFKTYNTVFTEAALIYEADMEAMFDYVVLITANYMVRKKRVIAGGKISERDFDKRNENQMDDEEKKKRADFVFENNGSVKELKQKADLLISLL